MSSISKEMESCGQLVCRSLTMMYLGHQVSSATSFLTEVESDVRLCAKSSVWILTRNDEILKQIDSTLPVIDDVWSLRFAATKLLSKYVKSSSLIEDINYFLKSSILSPASQIDQIGDISISSSSLFSSVVELLGSFLLNPPVDKLGSKLFLPTLLSLVPLFVEVSFCSDNNWINKLFSQISCLNSRPLDFQNQNLSPGFSQHIPPQQPSSVDDDLRVILVALEIMSAGTSVLESVERERPSRAFSDCPDDQWRGWKASVMFNRLAKTTQECFFDNFYKISTILENELRRENNPLQDNNRWNILSKILKSYFSAVSSFTKVGPLPPIVLVAFRNLFVRILTDTDMVHPQVFKFCVSDPDLEFFECLVDIMDNLSEFNPLDDILAGQKNNLKIENINIGDSNVDSSVNIDSNDAKCFAVGNFYEVTIRLMMNCNHLCCLEGLDEIGAQTFQQEQFSGIADPSILTKGSPFLISVLKNANVFINSLILTNSSLSFCDLIRSDISNLNYKKVLSSCLINVTRSSFLVSSECFFLASSLWQSLEELNKEESFLDSDGCQDDISNNLTGPKLQSMFVQEIGPSFLAAAIFYGNKSRLRNCSSEIYSSDFSENENFDREYIQQFSLIEESVCAFHRFCDLTVRTERADEIFVLLVDILERSASHFQSSSEIGSDDVPSLLISILANLTEQKLIYSTDIHQSENKTFLNQYNKLLIILQSIKLSPSIVSSLLILISRNVLAPSTLEVPATAYLQLTIRCSEIDPDNSAQTLMDISNSLGDKFESLISKNFTKTISDFVTGIISLASSVSATPSATSKFLASTAPPIIFSSTFHSEGLKLILAAIEPSLTRILNFGANGRQPSQSDAIASLFPHYHIVNRFLHCALDCSKTHECSDRISVLFSEGNISVNDLFWKLYSAAMDYLFILNENISNEKESQRIQKTNNYITSLSSCSSSRKVSGSSLNPFALSSCSLAEVFLFHIRFIVLCILRIPDAQDAVSSKFSNCLLKCLSDVNSSSRPIIQGPFSILSDILANEVPSEIKSKIFQKEFFSAQNLFSYFNSIAHQSSIYSPTSKQFAACVYPFWQLVSIFLIELESLSSASLSQYLDFLISLIPFAIKCFRTNDLGSISLIMDSIKSLSRILPANDGWIADVMFHILAHFPLWSSRSYIEIARLVDTISRKVPDIESVLKNCCVLLWVDNTSRADIDQYSAPSSCLREILNDKEKEIAIVCVCRFRGMRLRQVLFDLAAVVHEKRTNDMLSVYEFALSESPSAVVHL